MNKNILPKFLITTATTLCVLCSAADLFAKSAPVSAPENQYTLETQAKQYRDEGARYQAMGNLAEAKLWYQKAITLDPNFAVAYNDLGVVYETEGQTDKAEENYLKAVKVNPAYLSAYSNLAFLYEAKRDLTKAEFYWNKRATLGSPDDPWTQRAFNRLRDIRSVLSDHTFAQEREEDVMELMQNIKKDKNAYKKEDIEIANTYFQNAKKSFNTGDLAAAIKLALDAQQLDQDNKEIEAFIEKAELRALSR